jgi:hypothetical protein
MAGDGCRTGTARTRGSSPRQRYDEKVGAYLAAGRQLRVSVSEEQFKARRAEKPQRHLVKLHGSIEQPDTIVLTRSDYARARVDRAEMLGFLRSELVETAFLFVGFSLSDPNFGLLHDDIRLVYGLNVPASYTVQGRRNPVKQRSCAPWTSTRFGSTGGMTCRTS